MKNLEKLDLSSNKFSDNLPQCLGKLSKLRVLDLTDNMLSGNFPSFIVNLTSLEYLSLLENDNEGTFLLGTLANHSKLEVLHLSSRSSLLQVETENPQWHPTFQLKSLILQRCHLNMKSGRTIPAFLLFQNNLKYVDLSHNNMVGTFPRWLMQNNSGLKVFILRNNSLVGRINISSPKLAIAHLDISTNKISGLLPEDIGFLLPSIAYLNLSVNSFEGNIPSSIGEMRQLWSLDLSNNRFIGKIAEQLITNCTNLQYLRLSNNFLQGQIIPKSLIQNWLRYLYLNNNNFSGKVEEAVGNMTSLIVMDISNNSFSGLIPSSIGRCSLLKVLLMAENQLEGQIPSGLFNLQYLEILDLSHNKLSRFGPNLNLTSLRFLYLRKNALSGSIPYMFSVTSKLEVLDLSENKFCGHIPIWISKFSKLAVLLLGGNNFHGHIPIKLCEIKTYSMLDLSDNKFNGSIPSCIVNLPFQVPKYVDYHPRFEIFSSSDVIYDVFEDIYSNASMKLNEDFLQTMYTADVKVEVEFRTKSNYYSYRGKILLNMTGLDLSCNEFTGVIPPQFGNLQAILSLNLSHNFLSGSIPNTLSNLTLIESLDLSYNNLTGEIPFQLSQLHFLAIFNVSYNNLSGMPPNSGQFATFDENSYRGNPNLCGPLLRSCVGNTSPSPVLQSDEGESKEGAIDVVSFFWSFAGAYVSTLLGLAVVLCINVQWRLTWFRLVDRLMLYINVQLHMAWFRLADRCIP
ncbi:hypothetical protein L6164_028470 [Bauhinia variegata]|uniref:Uncharacterized protein n=1 Tax=Bauhinia variegata TaxID=167791 RepID=A0ACB9L5Q1_BAUVA|nr:hypothetical protein L6164_028470 [Bauhinia variegata]